MLLMRIVVTSLFLVLLSHSGARATPIYWSLFNIENETEQEARYVTYATLSDMLNDDNRLGVFAPDGPGTSERNIVGSGSDGVFYWSLFNIENETEQEARYVTYATLSDMLNDDNRLGVFAPDGPGTSERNIVGSGAWRRPITDPVAVPEPGPTLLVLAGVLALVGLRRSPDPGGKAGPPKRPRQASA